MSPAYRGGFVRFAQSYELKKDVVEELKQYAEDYVIVAMFADWCGDARRAIPVLSLLESKIDIEVRALGGMQKPPRGSDKYWAVPPSPKEVDTFGITSSPTIIIFKKSGEEVGRIKTRPRMTPTVEEEILKIIKDSEDE
ncbi:hypothetical protein EU545_05935 [Candidatus Thorarchaeota archaeon]|nr:MAG: hypothetical protein EU545_05935 [Candidatus Thorarchaeota archaeon]